MGVRRSNDLIKKKRKKESPEEIETKKGLT